MTITKRQTLALLIALGCGLTSCAWSVPASPGQNALARTPKQETSMVTTSLETEAGAEDSATEALYLARCGRCHVAHQPTAYSAGAWPFYVHKYGPRAGLFGEERERVLAWLQARAR